MKIASYGQTTVIPNIYLTTYEIKFFKLHSSSESINILHDLSTIVVLCYSRVATSLYIYQEECYQ